MALPWDKEYTYEQTIEVIKDLGTRHADRITETSTREWLKKAIASGDFVGLVGRSVDYSGSLSASDLIELRQTLGFFQKLEPLQIGVDKRAVAVQTFLGAEERCRKTNDDFRQWSNGALQFPDGVDGILHAAMRKIATVLGPVPAFKELDLAFGPGATTSVPRRLSCPRVKLSSRFSCSSNFLGILPAVLAELPVWFNNQVESVVIDTYDDGEIKTLEELVTVDVSVGKLAFVPKNAKTFRTVMTEPTLNTLVQSGYGKHIASRLRRVGLDITDQSLNRRLAREGSLTGVYATLDLSSASDTISRELVAHLLPYEWYSALDSCRTPLAEVDDQVIHLEKFSSMGNGFTFPLQTLIFWALASSCNLTDKYHHTQVYGDDIICHATDVDTIFRVFECCGFILNKDKSYWSGPFRESCGADYYLGMNIRPFYLKRLISCEVLFILHNHYVRNFDTEMAEAVLSLIPKEYHLWGPDNYGDGHLIGDWDRKCHKRDCGWGGYLFDTFTKIGRTHTRVLPGDRVLPFYTVYVSRTNNWLNTDVDVRHFEHDNMDLAIGSVFDKKRGILKSPLPGTKGYKRTTVYTLTNV